MNKLRKIMMVICIFMLMFVSCVDNYEYKNDNDIVSDTWYYDVMNFNKLHEYSKGKSQIIAFIDSGISPELEKEYQDRIIYKYDVVRCSNDVTDLDAHGTKMISIACNNGSYGVYGLASESKILIYKVTDEHGKTKSEYLSKAIEDAVNHGATIINISIGGYKNDVAVENAVNYALSQNVTIVAAGGDYGDKDLLYPAKYDGVISVQGLSSNLSLWENSNYEEKAVLTFPCQDIESVDIGYENELLKTKSTGTSQATALATSYIALIKDYYLEINNKDISNNELITILKDIDTFQNCKNEYTKIFCN